MAVTDASILPLLIARMQPQLPWGMSTQGRPMWEPTAPGVSVPGAQPVVPALSSRLPANLPLNTSPIRQTPQVNPEFTLQAMGQLRQPQLPPAAYPDMAPPPDQPPQVAAAPQQDVPRGTPLQYGQPDALMGYKPEGPSQGGAQPQSNALLYGLLAAGLGMLANNYGKYGQAGPPIGMGGLTGLNTFLGQRQQEEENARRQQLAEQQGEYQRGQLEMQARRADIDEQRMRAYENLVNAQAGDYKRKAMLFEEKNRLVGNIMRETDPAKRRELETQLGLLDNASQTLGNMWDIETQEIKEGAGAGQVRNVLIDKRTGKPIYTGSPYKQFSDQPLVSIGTTPTAPTGQMPSDIDFSAATGGSGFFGGAINTLTDAFGAGLAFPKTEEALRALDNLKVRTVTLLQSAIPGRPSNYLMQTLEKLSVSPGSLFQGDERAYTTLSETKRLISEEVKRMDGLLGTGMLTKGDVSNIVSNRTQLAALEKDYEHVLNNWSAKSKKSRATPEEIWERIQKEKNK